MTCALDTGRSVTIDQLLLTNDDNEEDVDDDEDEEDEVEDEEDEVENEVEDDEVEVEVENDEVENDDGGSSNAVTVHVGGLSLRLEKKPQNSARCR